MLTNCFESCRILYKVGRCNDLQTHLSDTELQQLDSASLDELMLSFRQAREAKQSSQFRGVSVGTDRNGWRAFSNVSGKQHHMGWFQTELEAAAAYDRFQIGIHGR